MYPALAVLQALSEAGSQGQTDLTTLQVLWVGGEKGMEEELVKRAGIPFMAIPAAGVHGVGLKALPANLARLGRGVARSRRILSNFRPQVMLFTGGYVAVPVAFSAWLPLRMIPRPRSLVYVPDIEPGWALKALVRMADHVALTVEESRMYIPSRIPSTVTGYPIRPELANWDKPGARQTLGLQPDLPVFLVMGGSRGARSINQALFSGLPQLLKDMQIVHVTGQVAWPEVEHIRQSLPVDLVSRYQAYPYLHQEMGAALASADLVLSRAGASSLGEYPMFGLPAILAPYPYAWRYQSVNAQYLVERGAAVLIKDADLAKQLLPIVQDILFDSTRRHAMASAMRSMAHPQAAQSIAGKLRSLAANSS